MFCFGYYVDTAVFHRAGRSSHTAQSPQRAASPDNFAGSVPMEQDHQKKPRQALVVKRRWATQLLEAQKTWETRGTQLHKRGRYALRSLLSRWRKLLFAFPFRLCWRSRAHAQSTSQLCRQEHTFTPYDAWPDARRADFHAQVNDHNVASLPPVAGCR